MVIGIPKEILAQERRVAALPETVRKYVGMGFKVLVETSAGAGVFHPDSAYASAGAEIVQSAKALFDRSDLVLKVKQPCFNRTFGTHEAKMVREGSILVTFLHPAAPTNHDMVRILQNRNITALTMDGIPRISRAQKMDALTSMSTITGYKSVIMAANQLPKFMPMIGTAIGVIKPANVVVIGAGVVGLQAIATAKRLGAVVKAADIRAEARREAGSLKGTEIVGFEVPDELAIGEGGYAKALPSEWLSQEREVLARVVAEADIVILSALVPGEVAPVLVTEPMVRSMRPGSVIVDVAIDQGGNCALTKGGSDVLVDGVHVCGTENIPGSMAVHASWLYANNVFHYVENLFKHGIGQPDLDDEIVRHSLVTHQGKLVHQGALKAMSKI